MTNLYLIERLTSEEKKSKILVNKKNKSGKKKQYKNQLLKIYCSPSASISAEESTVPDASGVKPHEAPKKRKNCEPDNDD